MRTELNLHALVAWMYIWETYHVCADEARNDPEFIRLMLNLMKSYPDEFEAISKVRIADARLLPSLAARQLVDHPTLKS